MVAYLYDVERNLQSMWRDLSDRPGELGPVFCELEKDFDEPDRVTILAEIACMFKELERVKNAYELRPERDSAKKKVLASLVEVVTTIDELSPKDLAKYGPLPAEDQERVNQLIGDMNKILDRMLSAL